MPSLSEVLNAIKPAVDAGGQLVLISTVDKAVPLSTFKQLFRSAYYDRSSNYTPIFFSWRARPDRTDEWYQSVAADMYQQNQSNDDLYQEYPESPEQALAPRQLDKRIPFDWLQACRAEAVPLAGSDLPGVPGLAVYVRPQPGRRYVIGADPAEGNPTSDDSAATVVDAETWEEVATFAGRWEPRVFGGYIDQVGVYFNAASVLAERNNHGHALIMALEATGELALLRGHSDEKPGWLSNVKGNTLLVRPGGRRVQGRLHAHPDGDHHRPTGLDRGGHARSAERHARGPGGFLLPGAGRVQMEVRQRYPLYGHPRRGSAGPVRRPFEGLVTVYRLFHE